ncbi:MAG TPA: glutathione S-transferase N-terminal domain-containing protein [Solirubrobacteraceae bacterium]|nr:glutathione S-transferase N-terminal domain-containing protein [Solirubrobacteraceae bacterium]
MKLYVCWGTFPSPVRPGGHPCRNALQALEQAGHRPEVVRTYGFGALPAALNGPRRAHVKRLTGQSWVPALELDDGTAISGSSEIADWARTHPAA